MKRIIGFLTLISFLVASNIHPIHATEMNEIIKHENSLMTKIDESIFCDISNTPETQCSKEMMPEKFVQKQEDNNLDIRIALYSYFVFLDKEISIHDSEDCQNIPWKIPIFQKSSYYNLNGIIKNLN